MNLKAALFFSAVIHMGFFSLRAPGFWDPIAGRLLPPHVSVLLEPSLPPEARKPASVEKTAAPALIPQAAPKRSEPERVAQRPKLPPSPSLKPMPALNPAVTLKQAPAPAAASPPTAAMQGVVALPEGEFAAIQHKELVRQHLKLRLRYPETWLQGTVRLKVTLSPDGALRDAAVLDASDPRLTPFALRDARSAAPYPRFPREMKEATADYEFLVQYSPD